MDSIFPQDLLDLKLRVDHWRTTRRFIREALLTELRDAITKSLSRHPVSKPSVSRKLSVIRRDLQKLSVSLEIGLLISSRSCNC